VSYDGVSDTSLFTVRVDGKLLFATDRDTRMVVDTPVVAKTGLLQIGTSEHPVQDGVTADIVIADNGPIDVNWDPLLLSRGILSHRSTDIHGQKKTSFLKLALDPVAGSTSLHLDEDAASSGPGFRSNSAVCEVARELMRVECLRCFSMRFSALMPSGCTGRTQQ
jgi:hypothetical protein